MVDTPDTDSSDPDETLISGRRQPPDPGSPSKPPSRVASLVIVAHPDETWLGRRFVLDPSSASVIGRSPDVQLSFPTVRELSRSHSKIECRFGTFFITDLQSTNGTFLNRRPVEAAARLRNGDRIDCDLISLKFLEGDDDEQVYHDTIYELVTRDELTGIHNRRKYDEEVDRDFASAKRHSRPLALVLFDVDGFKSINDRFGHPQGDQVLVEIATLCEKSLRKEEVFARVGGDEFLILCPEVTASEATVLAERLRRRIAAHPFTLSGAEIRVTCSFGVAERNPAMKTPNELYSAADQLLYRSKEDGRNLVTSSAGRIDRQAAEDS